MNFAGPLIRENASLRKFTQNANILDFGNHAKAKPAQPERSDNSTETIEVATATSEESSILISDQLGKLRI